MTGTLVVTGAGGSHRGLVRDANEDAILTDPTGVLWAVVDGMGGHGHGDLAADLVIDALARVPHGDAGRALLGAALGEAHADIQARSEADGLGQIGATVVALMLDHDRAVVGWAGDSRAYLLRAGTLTPITRDHSLVQELVDQAVLTPAQAEGHPQANVVTRAIGVGDAAEPEFAELTVAAGDRLLLCSDGLTRVVPEVEIADRLAAAPDPDSACHALIEATLAQGAPDNVSAVVVAIDEAQ
ncbi:MAG: protein phosphatase 2C domain-containing protein [Amaricoccus sp.]